MVLPLGCTSGKEKRNLDHIKRIASAQARRANPLFVSEEFEHYRLIVSAHLRGAPNFAAFIRHLSDMFDPFCTLDSI